MSTLRSMLDLSRPTFSHHWSSTPFLCANIDRKSTRLNSSHTVISYAVFCLKKEEHTSELQSHSDLVCRLLLEIKIRRSPIPTVSAPLYDLPSRSYFSFSSDPSVICRTVTE